jgi:hypothetical protein
MGISQGDLEQIEIGMGIVVSISNKMEGGIRRCVAADGKGTDSKRLNGESQGFQYHRNLNQVVIQNVDHKSVLENKSSIV